jgi:hemerythrin-like domain-containing protein
MSDSGDANVGQTLVRVHWVVTRALDVAAQRCAEFLQSGSIEPALSSGFVAYLTALHGALHGHHVGEDEVAFPYLRDKLPDAPFEQLSQDHRAMEPILASLSAATESLAKAGDPIAALPAVQRAVADLTALWHPHIVTEEQHISAETTAKILTPDEQIALGAQLGQHAQQHAQPAPLVIPFVLYNLPPDERAKMAQGMPPIVTQELVPLAWKEQWMPMKPFFLE